MTNYVLYLVLFGALSVHVCYAQPSTIPASDQLKNQRILQHQKEIELYKLILAIEKNDSVSEIDFAPKEGMVDSTVYLGGHEEKKTSVRMKSIHPRNPEDNDDALETFRKLNRKLRADSRLEMAEVSEIDTSFVPDGNSTVGLVERSRIEKLPDGSYQLDNSMTYGSKYSLCPTEAFYRQPSTCYCTGVVVGPDLVLTARHCLLLNNAKNTKLIFGYETDTYGNNPRMKLDSTMVYEATLVGESMIDHGDDYILMKTDRPMINRAIAKPDVNVDIDFLHSIGYPAGLPLKMIYTSKIFDNTDPSFMFIGIDAFVGNSGSPVFNSITHSLVGILLEGGSDFVSYGNCKITDICREKDCRGEKVLRISKVLPILKQLGY